MEDLFGFVHRRSGTHTVRFQPAGIALRVAAGTLLLDAAREAGLPVAQSCGGFAVCSWCRMQVLEGWENLSPIERPEERLIARQQFAPNERASCQAAVFGDVVVTTTYW
ncbi:MAG: (2Fe-2S)-binding protein [Bacteroidetes bacterium]|nr:(2Fe-2S)-binding protein [Bacteroidota bacterium]